MLDSLVRVSRRVGQVTDRFATDARCDCKTSGHCNAAVRGHWRQSPQFEQHGRARACSLPRKGLPRSTSGPMRSGSITPPPKRGPPSPNASDRRQTDRGASRAESAPTAVRKAAPRLPRGIPKTQDPHGRRVESSMQTLRSSPFASKRFHVLLNSLFKVLFNFPSRYLFAIGLVSVFSLRWSLPPALGCNLKQPDSRDGLRELTRHRRGLTPALGEAPIRRTRTPGQSP